MNNIDQAGARPVANVATTPTQDRSRAQWLWLLALLAAPLWASAQDEDPTQPGRIDGSFLIWDIQGFFPLVGGVCWPLIIDIDLAPQGGYYVGGHFESINFFPIKGLARLTHGGGVDPTFIPTDVSGAVYDYLDIHRVRTHPEGGVVAEWDGMSLFDPSGKLVPSATRLSLTRTWYDARDRRYILTTDGSVRRYGTNGSLDRDYRPRLPRPVQAMAVAPDGRVYCSYKPVWSLDNTTGRTNLTRPAGGLVCLNPDGSVDTEFLSGEGPSVSFCDSFDSPPPEVSKILVHPEDGKVVIQGNFKHYDGSSLANGVVRIHGYSQPFLGIDNRTEGHFIYWGYGALESRSDISDDWEPMESWTSPHQLEFTEGSRMFRVARPVPELDGEAVDN